MHTCTICTQNSFYVPELLNTVFYRKFRILKHIDPDTKMQSRDSWSTRSVCEVCGDICVCVCVCVCVCESVLSDSL